ncbi:MAG: hypothetical protein PHV59_11040, partial [Victivallales bacterium]|nr:hypothetical protein [Victivallales bacterium]
ETARYLLQPPVSLNTIRAGRNGKLSLAEGWYRRIWLYRNLDPDKIPELDRMLADQFERNWKHYEEKLEASLEQIQKLHRELCPGAPLICGEGFTFCGSNLLHWEESSEAVWKLMALMLKRYRETGIQGTVIRTCCGPEDPSWNLRAAEITALNRQFLEE